MTDSACLARGFFQRLIVAACLLGLLPGVGAQQPVTAEPVEPGTIEEIRVQGLARMSRQAFLQALGTREGDTYDERVIRRNFRSLWDKRLFEDITIFAEDGPRGGKVLIVRIEERPVLTSVEFDDTKVLSRTEIEDALKEQDLELEISKPLDMGRVFFAESAVRELLAQKGFLSATVDAEVSRVTETTRALRFRIEPGGKTRIRGIEFTGNEVFRDGQLTAALELTQPRKWYWPWSRKNLYHELKWDQDVSNIRNLYLNQGYLDVALRTPVVEVRGEEGELIERETPGPEPAAPEAVVPPEPTPPDLAEDVHPKVRERRLRAYERQMKRWKKKVDKASKKNRKKAGKKWVYLTVPVEEGPQYRVGEVSFSGNEVFDTEMLRRFVLMREDDVFNNAVLDFAVDSITRLYENKGHLFVNVARDVERREGELLADISLAIDENDPYMIERIQFNGNTATLDGVLRREWALLEGDTFNRDRLEVSKRRLNQLGFVQTTEEPVIDPIEGAQAAMVTVAIEEQGRNEIQVGGGYSGLDGAFFNGVYSTRNFLGRGQVLSAALQVGGRSNRYQISFQEPWFLNRPILLGFNVFRRDVDFGSSLQSTSDGFGIVTGRRLGRFSRFNIGYNLERVDSTTRAASTLEPIRTEETVSSITPVFSYSTINNPYRPTRGSQISLAMQVAGGPLGGESAFIKPTLRMTSYAQALRGRAYWAFHGQLGYVGEWADGSEVAGAVVNGVPRFQRFWLGGDTQGPRIFDTRTITPLRYVKRVVDGNRVTFGEVLADPSGVPVTQLFNSGGSPILIEVGGDRFFLFQSELVFPVNEQVEIAAFLDAGDSLFEDQSFGFETTRISAGVELRFHLPIFPVPLRLIYGVPVRELEFDRSNSFSFSVGRSF